MECANGVLFRGGGEHARRRRPEREDVAKRVPVYRVQASRNFRGRFIVARFRGFDGRKEAGEERILRLRSPSFAKNAQIEHSKTVDVVAPPSVGPPPARGADIGEKGIGGRSPFGDQLGLVAVFVAGVDIRAARQEELYHGKTLGNILRGAAWSRSVGGPHERCAAMSSCESRVDGGSHI